ncbi:hypothetical protein, partial [Mycobacterium tuberculosis]
PTHQFQVIACPRAGDAHTAGQPGRAVGLGMPGVGLPVSAAKPGGCR